MVTYITVALFSPDMENKIELLATQICVGSLTLTQGGPRSCRQLEP